MKICTKCKKELPLDCFYKRKPSRRYRNTHRSWCKKCDLIECKKWQKDNSVMFLKRVREYKKAHREMYNFHERARKYFLRNPHLFGTHSFKEWENLKVQYGFQCPCCGVKEPEIKLTEDHIKPVSVGGLNTIENIQPLCGRCNRIKNNKIIKYEIY